MNRFTWEISSKSSWIKFDIADVWRYRHLLLRLVRRDLLVHHQQTLLGPLWIALQPLFMLLIYILVFDRAVGLSTDGLPPILFYLSGIILWSLFSESFNGTAFTFMQNGQLFSKVYFPRLVVPLATIVLNLVRFGIQMLLLVAAVLVINASLLLDHPVRWLAAILVSSGTVAILGLGTGLLFSVLTAKYRDMVNIIHVIVRLLMFATPIIYPMSAVAPEFQPWLAINPLTPLVELFRWGILGQGTFDISQMVYAFSLTAVMAVFGIMLFNKYASKLQDVI